MSTADADEALIDFLTSTPVSKVDEILVGFDRYCDYVLAAVKEAVVVDGRTGDDYLR